MSWSAGNSERAREGCSGSLTPAPLASPPSRLALDLWSAAHSRFPTAGLEGFSSQTAVAAAWRFSSGLSRSPGMELGLPASAAQHLDAPSPSCRAPGWAGALGKAAPVGGRWETRPSPSCCCGGGGAPLRPVPAPVPRGCKPGPRRLPNFRCHLWSDPRQGRSSQPRLPLCAFSFVPPRR